MPKDVELDEYDYWVNGERYAFMPEKDADQGVSVHPIIIINDENIVVQKKKSTGCQCTGCDNFYEYAEPNQKDGTFICWGCRY